MTNDRACPAEVVNFYFMMNYEDKFLSYLMTLLGVIKERGIIMRIGLMSWIPQFLRVF